MINKEVLFESITDILRRRHKIAISSSGLGAFDLYDEGRTIRITLSPALLTDYFNQLEGHDIPGLHRLPKDEQDQARIDSIVMWVEEIFESDINLSLTEIRLEKSVNGRVSLVDQRGPSKRPLPFSGEKIGYWSSSKT